MIAFRRLYLTVDAFSSNHLHEIRKRNWNRQRPYERTNVKLAALDEWRHFPRNSYHRALREINVVDSSSATWRTLWRKTRWCTFSRKKLLELHIWICSSPSLRLSLFWAPVSLACGKASVATRADVGSNLIFESPSTLAIFFHLRDLFTSSMRVIKIENRCMQLG